MGRKRIFQKILSHTPAMRAINPWNRNLSFACCRGRLFIMRTFCLLFAAVLFSSSSRPGGPAERVGASVDRLIYIVGGGV